MKNTIETKPRPDTPHSSQTLDNNKLVLATRREDAEQLSSMRALKVLKSKLKEQLASIELPDAKEVSFRSFNLKFIISEISVKILTFRRRIYPLD
jgi:ribosomal protein S3AE